MTLQRGMAALLHRLGALSAGMLLACSVNSPPNAVLVCDRNEECPDGFLCTAWVAGKVCCRNGNCGDGGWPTDGGNRDGSGQGGRGGQGGQDNSDARLATGGSGGQGNQSGQGGQGGKSGPNGIILLLDDGFDEMDLDTTCVGTTCITGGITP